jgi:hypothetical protein
MTRCYIERLIVFVAIMSMPIWLPDVTRAVSTTGCVVLGAPDAEAQAVIRITQERDEYA